MTTPSTSRTPAEQVSLQISGNELVLRCDGTVFLPATRTLLVADLHLGKDASFRAAGIPVPAGANQETLEILDKAIDATRPDSFCLLGDLIHDRNSLTPQVVEEFAAWRKRNACLQVCLMLGNHDRHAKEFPETWNLEIAKTRRLGKLLLCHQTSTDRCHSDGVTQIGGHWHPVVGFGNQADRIRLRCFVVDPVQITLPAVGPFKGGMLQSRKPNRAIFAIADGQIWSI